MKSAIAALLLGGSGVLIDNATNPDSSSGFWWLIGAVAICVATGRIIHSLRSGRQKTMPLDRT